MNVCCLSWSMHVCCLSCSMHSCRRLLYTTNMLAGSLETRSLAHLSARHPERPRSLWPSRPALPHYLPPLPHCPRPAAFAPRQPPPPTSVLCLTLKRATLTPASTSCVIAAASRVAGPIVATILVFRKRLPAGRRMVWDGGGTAFGGVNLPLSGSYSTLWMNPAPARARAQIATPNTPVPSHPRQRQCARLGCSMLCWRQTGRRTW